MISKIVLIGLGLVLVAKSQQRAKTRQAMNPFYNLDNPTVWGADAWGRLQGVDLTLNGQHPVASPMDAYGMQGEMSVRVTGGM